MSVEQEIHVIDLLPGYVLDALTEEELAQVVEHLASCPTCQVEYRHLQSVADDLPLAVAQTTPPPRVKSNLMRSIHISRTTNPALPRSLWQVLGEMIKKPLPALGLAVILLLVVANALLLRQVLLTRSASTTPMRLVALASTNFSPQAAGTLVMDRQGDFGTLVVDNLSALDPAHQYQVWLTRDGERTSGGLFSVNQEGYASLEIQAPRPLIQYDSVGITIEPFGGSFGPTGNKVLGGNIPH